MERVNLNESSNSLNIKMDYAWNWFSYHANQRLIAFRFFLIILGIIIIGYFQYIESTLFGINIIIGILGLIISLSFWFLDIRNLELINCGRKALDDLEKELGLNIRKNDSERNCLEGSLDSITKYIPKIILLKVVKYQCIFRFVYCSTAFIFLILIICSFLKYFGIY